MTKLIWTKDEAGNYNSDIGNWRIVKTPGRRFRLTKFCNLDFERIMTGSLKACQERAQQVQNAIDAEAIERQTKLDESVTKQQETPRGWDSTATPEPDPLHILADDGNPHHEDELNICPGVNCNCASIDYGMTCPAHGRKLKGGVEGRVNFETPR